MDMNFIVATIRMLLLILGSIYYLLLGYLGLLFTKRSIEYSNTIQQNWGKYCVRILGIMINLKGLLPEGSGIVMANHRSYLDIFILLSLYPGSMVGKIELKKWPILRWAPKLGRMILIDRSSLISMKKTMGKITDEVNTGNSVILFPEGTSFKGPLTKDFKSGTFAVAANNQIKITPVAIQFSNVNDAWVDVDLFIPHFFRQMGKKNTYVSIQFGKPIKLAETEQLKNAVHKSINTMLINLQPDLSAISYEN